MANRNPIAQRKSATDSIRAHGFHAAALRYREKSLQDSLARRIAARLSRMSAQAAFNSCQDHALALARAHVERVVLETFQQVARDDPRLESVCALYGLWRVEQDLAWFLENDFVAARRARAVRKELATLTNDLVYK